MPASGLSSGYGVRIAVRRNRWRVTVFDLATRRGTRLDSFEALPLQPERASSRPGCSGRSGVGIP